MGMTSAGGKEQAGLLVARVEKGGNEGLFWWEKVVAMVYRMWYGTVIGGVGEGHCV